MTRFGSFELDAGRRQLFSHGAVIHLTPKAFDLLALLIDAAPQVVPKVAASCAVVAQRRGIGFDARRSGEAAHPRH